MNRLLNGVAVGVAVIALAIVGIRAVRACERGLNERVACILIAALFFSLRAGLIPRVAAVVALLLTSVPFRPPIERIGGFLCIFVSGFLLSGLDQKNERTL